MESSSGKWPHLKTNNKLDKYQVESTHLNDLTCHPHTCPMVSDWRDNDEVSIARIRDDLQQLPSVMPFWRTNKWKSGN